LGNAYRDPGLTIAAQVGELAARVRRLEERLTPQLRELLPRALAGRLEQLRQDATSAPGDSEPSLQRRARVLEAEARALEEAIALAPQLERDLARAPQGVPALSPRFTPLEVRERTDALVRRIWRMLREIDEHASVHAVAPSFLRCTHFVGRFHLLGCPFSLLLQPLLQPAAQPLEDTMEHTLATFVSPLIPSFRLQPERLFYRPLVWLGQLARIQVEGRGFLFDGGATTQRRVLAGPVWDALRDLARAEGAIAVEVTGDTARCRWHGPIEPRVLTAAAALLAAIRRAERHAALLR